MAAAAASTLWLLGARADGAVGVGIALGLAAAAVADPSWGYAALLFVAILADRHLWEFSQWTEQLGFYVFENWWTVLSTGGQRRFTLLRWNTVDVVLLAIVLGLGSRVVRRRTRLVVSADGVLGVCALLTLGVMLAYGLATGGSGRAALWQVRPLAQFVVFGLAGAEVLSTRADVHRVVRAFGAAALFKALQINWIFFVDQHARFGDWRTILGHEDSVFQVAVIVLAVALLVYRAPGFARWALVCAATMAAAALALNLRRAAYVAAAMSLLAMPLLLDGRRRAALGVVTAFLLALGAYGAVAWSHPDAALAVPMRRATTVLAPRPGSLDEASNQYRVVESYNLARTIAARPLGLGFGHPFEVHLPLPDISFLLPLWQYHPHNMILGIWSAVGSIGFALWLSYLGAAVMLASHALRWHAEPATKALAYAVLMSLVSGLLVSALDQFIWTDRGALVLGAAVALATVLHRAVEPA